MRCGSGGFRTSPATIKDLRPRCHMTTRTQVLDRGEKDDGLAGFGRGGLLTKRGLYPGRHRDRLRARGGGLAEIDGPGDGEAEGVEGEEAGDGRGAAAGGLEGLAEGQVDADAAEGSDSSGDTDQGAGQLAGLGERSEEHTS